MKLAVMVLIISISGIILFTQTGMSVALSCIEAFLDFVFTHVDALY